MAVMKICNIKDEVDKFIKEEMEIKVEEMVNEAMNDLFGRFCKYLNGEISYNELFPEKEK